MRIKKFIENFLCVACVLLGFCGGILTVGTVGALEMDNISFTQFFVQEAIAAVCIMLTRLTYLLYEYIKYEQYRY
jgi:hypothetical protein